MKEFALRLKNGDDLKKKLEEICIEKHFNTAIVLSGVGSLKKAHIRLAGALNELEIEEDFEIVSLMGTISNGKAHLHISLSDEISNCIGGHLKEGSLINTTGEIVLGVLEEYTSERVYDEATGFDEIDFRKKVNYD